jgi:hypothetical protein
MAQDAVIIKKQSIFNAPALLSAVFMGLGQIIQQKQYIKGLFFALTEVVFLINANRFYTVLKNLISLGDDNRTCPLPSATTLFL